MPHRATILKALRRALPAEDFVFVGDLAHLPYGDKSSASIRYYSDRIVRWLVEVHQVKGVVIACNSASASAAHYLRQRWGQHVPIVDVIDPMVDEVICRQDIRTVGVIGTRRTVRSGAYQRRFQLRAPHLHVKARATPLLAPMIEEGFFNNNISRTILRNYLPFQWTHSLDVLILGCTHYPLIRDEIREVLAPTVTIIDSTQVIPGVVRRQVNPNDPLPNRTGEMHIFVTEWSDAFRKSLNVFMGGYHHPTILKLWET